MVQTEYAINLLIRVYYAVKGRTMDHQEESSRHVHIVTHDLRALVYALQHVYGYAGVIVGIAQRTSGEV